MVYLRLLKEGFLAAFIISVPATEKSHLKFKRRNKIMASLKYLKNAAEFYYTFIQFLLGKTYHHFLCQLPKKPGFISGLFFKLLYRNIRLDEKNRQLIEGLSKEGVIVYVSKYKSFFNYLFSYARLRNDGLPYATIGFDHSIYGMQSMVKLFRVFLARIDYFFRGLGSLDPYSTGFVRDRLIAGDNAFMSLIDSRAFYLRFIKSKTDPIQHLLELQKTMEKPIFLVPELVFFSINPDRSNPSLLDIILGSQEKPGRLRRLFILFKSSKKVFVDFSEPVNLKEYLGRPEIAGKHPEFQALSLRFNLIDRLNRHRQSVTGPILKSREEIKESVLSSYDIRSFIESQAKEQDASIYSLRKKADAYIDEIAANYSMKWIKIYDIVLTWMLKNIFEGMVVDVNGLAELKKASHSAPLVLVPCHKSHLDYLILSYVFHHHHMPCPHIAAGKNLSFWPMGTIFRGGGAFFLRRTFKGNLIYSRIFGAYIAKLLEEGFNLEFFIEGGRSRSGKLLYPKMGLMSYLFDAYKKESCPDLMFVPINIGYDRVLEEKAYLHEREGGAKQEENISQVVGARKFLKKRYGKVYVNFSQPISFKQYLQDAGIDIKSVEKEEKHEICCDMGLRIINSIAEVGMVTPHGIVASALLNSQKKRLEYSHLHEEMGVYLNYLVAQNARLADTLNSEPDDAFDSVLESFLDRGFIEKYAGDDVPLNETNIFVKENKRPLLDYYKNSCISFFIPAAYTALSILENDAFQFTSLDLHKTYSVLKEMFRFEFPDTSLHDSARKVRRNLKAFIDDAIIVPHHDLPDTYNITSSGFRKLKLFARFLRAFMESLLIVLTSLEKHPFEELDEKEHIKKMFSAGNKMFRSSDIECGEAISKENFRNALLYLNEKGIRSDADIRSLCSRVQKFLEIMN